MANKRKKVAFKRSDDDISKKTLAVFVAIVVIVSVVGTWLILTNNVAIKTSESVQGTVKLSVGQPGAEGPKEPVPSTTGGEVKLIVGEAN